jgi:DNA repair exonuclease SbcCD ATPase subunit
MLELKKLVMENFGPIEGQKEILFTPGINILNASNGKGKSNTNFAIEMLLLDNHEDAYDQYINWNKDYFNISLLFSLNNIDYQISLKCKKGKNQTTSDKVLKLIDTDKELATGESVKIKLEELFTASLAKYGLSVKQKNQDNVVTIKDAERRELLKRVFEYNYNKEVKEQIETKIEIIKETIIGIDKEIYRLENLKYEPKELKELVLSTEDYNKEKSELEKLNKDQETYLAKKELRYNKEKEKDNKNTLIEEKKESIQTNTNKIDIAKGNIEKIEKRNIQEEYSNKKQELKNILVLYQEKKFEELETIKKSYEEKEKDINSNLKETEKQISEIVLLKIAPFNGEELQKHIHNKATKENELKSKNIKLETKDFINKEIVEIENKNIELGTELKTVCSNILSLESGICPLCGNNCTHQVEEYQNKVEEINKQIEENKNSIRDIKGTIKQELENEIKILEEDIDNIGKNIQEQENKKKDIDDRIEKNNKNKELKTELQNKVNSLQTALLNEQTIFEEKKKSILNEINNQEKNVQQNIDSLSIQEKKEIQSVQDQLVKEKEIITELEDNNKNNEISIEKYNKEVEEIINWLNQFDRDLVVINLEQLNKLRKDVEDYDTIVIENNQIKKDNELLLKQKIENDELLVTKNKDKEKLNKDKYNYEQAKVILLNEFPNYAIDMNVKDIENNMNNFIEQIYYKSLNLSLRPTKTSIKLEYGTGERMIDANRLSGAESKLVQISFTNIFNRQLDLQCLILDEPDAALDDQNKLELYSSLLEMKNVYKQMIITTHSEKMKNYLLSNGGEDINLITF